MNWFSDATGVNIDLNKAVPEAVKAVAGGGEHVLREIKNQLETNPAAWSALSGSACSPPSWREPLWR
jgi:hypothetical protein